MGRVQKIAIALAALLLTVPVWASTLPFKFVLDKVTDAWAPHKKGGLIVQWEVQRYSRGAPVGAPAKGTLSLRGGMYRAEAGEGDARVVRLYDNTRGVTLMEGRVAPMAPETVASLPEGIFLRGRDSLASLLESYGISGDTASWGRMPQPGEELMFRPVLRYGAAAGPDDLTHPQVWIEPHRFLIHRIVALEGDQPLVVDYRGHGAVAETLPWLPSDITVRLGGKILWTGHLTGVSDKLPTDKTFSVQALEAEATR